MSKPPQALIPTLHNLSSSQSLRVLWALEELKAAHGTEFKFVNYSRRSKADAETLKSIHSIGKSPILTLETTDGQAPPTFQVLPGVLSESKLILKFLSEEFGKGLWEPESEEERNRDLFFAELGTATLTLKVDFAMLFQVTAALLPWGLRHMLQVLVSPVTNYFVGDLQPVFETLENALSEERPWFGGRKLGLSDFNVVFGLEMADQRGYFDGKKWPRLREWLERVHGRGAYKRAREEGGKYDLVNFA
ncbi:hypothetical protein BCR34DRAFT_627274 [Clohesyomyces aquaticus]|uniref:GST C-terminal domain-containing protein n=1 Tax=Clohesyomyces aquaticus TaxID=1231657 RepID=A0A1Y1Z0A7_9PLEO|nr:hypothetical protein BCR34DRAFT_627274 [Clohesyomyces aquaticus]